MENECIQHNPNVASGKKAFINLFEEATEGETAKRVEFKRIFSEQNYVIVYCYHKWPGRKEFVGIDIFRLDENDKTVEHWDVLQPISEKMAHDIRCFENDVLDVYNVVFR